MRPGDAEQMGEKGEMLRRAPEELRTATAEGTPSDGQSGGQGGEEAGDVAHTGLLWMRLVLTFLLLPLLFQHHNPAITSSFAELCWQKSRQWQQGPAP